MKKRPVEIAAALPAEGPMFESWSGHHIYLISNIFIFFDNNQLLAWVNVQPFRSCEVWPTTLVRSL